MREIITMVVEVAAAGAIAYGAWLIYEPAAYIMAGAIVLFLAQGIGRA